MKRTMETKLRELLEAHTELTRLREQQEAKKGPKVLTDLWSNQVREMEGRIVRILKEGLGASKPSPKPALRESQSIPDQEKGGGLNR